MDTSRDASEEPRGDGLTSDQARDRDEAWAHLAETSGDTEPARCATCEGTGEVFFKEDDTEACPDCNGTGNAPASDDGTPADPPRCAYVHPSGDVCGKPEIVPWEHAWTPHVGPMGHRFVPAPEPEGTVRALPVRFTLQKNSDNFADTAETWAEPEGTADDDDDWDVDEFIVATGNGPAAESDNREGTPVSEVEMTARITRGSSWSYRYPEDNLIWSSVFIPEGVEAAIRAPIEAELQRARARMNARGAALETMDQIVTRQGGQLQQMREALRRSEVTEASARNALYGMTRAFSKERAKKVAAESELAHLRALANPLEDTKR